ncbi:hypothetical protein GY45DRAFT_34618 [Cubamyces sp. BRFM 1775]|nr:hypothetical protein GY45DRAFT_34618 [Cubamyces sp. BRFM 1775]
MSKTGTRLLLVRPPRRGRLSNFLWAGAPGAGRAVAGGQHYWSWLYLLGDSAGTCSRAVRHRLATDSERGFA